MSADVKGGHKPGRLAAANELLAHGEFSSLAHNNGRNALAAADAVLTLVGFDDLLEALTLLDTLIDFAEPASDDKPMTFTDWSELNAAFVKARAAIAKAEGPSS